ncbi:hypothetical protein Q8F55_005690 [Vanrija albida]|uniref:Uncharacterized protein n=1 Tax=Vanrija albida TaxID=181172 RepID=A0ABR3Q2J4_9TREE
MGRPDMNTHTHPPTDPIAANLDKHRELTGSLGELAYAPGDLATARAVHKRAGADLAAKQARLAKLDPQVKDRYKQWQASQTSTTTRLFAKIRNPGTGGEALARRIQTEQNEYEMVFNEQQEVQGAIKGLQERLAQLTDEIDTLAQLSARHGELREQLLALYARVFDGPTPGYPEEDEQEGLVNATRLHAGEVDAALQTDRHVLALLTQALECAERAARQFRKAQKAGSDQNGNSRRGHHNAKGKRNYHEARGLLDRAASVQPQLPRFEGELPRSGFWSGNHSEKKHFCRALVQHNVLMRDMCAGAIATAERDLADAQARIGDGVALLEGIRCRIMEERGCARGGAPPLYEGGGVGVMA